MNKYKSGNLVILKRIWNSIENYSGSKGKCDNSNYTTDLNNHNFLQLKPGKEFEIIDFTNKDPVSGDMVLLYSHADNVTIRVFKSRLGDDFLPKPINYNKYWAKLNEMELNNG